MKLRNKSNVAMVVHNGKTFIRVESGECCEMDDKAGMSALARFGRFLEEAKPENKKAPSKGKDKKMAKIED